jgi:hypothetical protein
LIERQEIRAISKTIPQRDAYLGIFGISMYQIRLRCQIVSELKCCKRCGAFLTCEHKGECCVECDYFDPVDVLCMAGPEKKPKPQKEEMEVEVDPETFLFEEDEEDDDVSDLPPERDLADVDDDIEEEEEEDDVDIEEDDDDEW